MLASRADILLAGHADVPSQQTAASTISHFHSWRWLNYRLFYNFWFNRTLISSLFTMCYKMSCIPLLSPQTLHQIICIQALINAHQTEATICKEEDGCFQVNLPMGSGKSLNHNNYYQSLLFVFDGLHGKGHNYCLSCLTHL